MPNDLDPIHDQRRVQRQLLAVAQKAIGSAPIQEHERLPVDLEAERALRDRAEVLLDGPAGEWLKARRDADAADVAHRALAGITVAGQNGGDCATADDLLAVARNPPPQLKKLEEPARSLLEFTAVALAAERLTDAET